MPCTSHQRIPLRPYLRCHAEQTPRQSQKLCFFILHKVKQPIAGCSQAIEAPHVMLTAVAKHEHRHLPPYLHQHGPAERTLTLTNPTVLFNATSKSPLCFNAHFSYIFLPRYLQTSSLWVAFSFCGKELLDLVQAGLTVGTLALGCVQFLVAKQICCGDPSLVLQNTRAPVFCWAGQCLPPSHCCSPSALKLHPRANVASRSAGCIKP